MVTTTGFRFLMPNSYLSDLLADTRAESRTGVKHSATATGGRYKVFADKYEGKRFNCPNDVIVGPDGAIYFTDSDA
jgi:sugar lactone lactonase YvrE